MKHPGRVRVLMALTLATGCGGSKVAQISPDRGLPPEAPAAIAPFVAEYGTPAKHIIVLERDGGLVAYDGAAFRALKQTSPTVFGDVEFQRDARGRPGSLRMSGQVMPRLALGPESGNQLLVTPVRPLAELRREALAASPPHETGPFKPTNLVELVKLDPTIKLEIRYATSNNLFGTPFYSQARAFLQREPAEALVRANTSLKARGYGLLIHDGYRPWYVTKMFWEASPVEKRIFVANPAEGSKHNRGAAVDLTLYELSTGAPVEMVSTYDETTDRAAADYAGGTSRQRWYRALLRRAMEEQGFIVNPTEWWHFDYRDWKSYGIGNLAFERL